MTMVDFLAQWTLRSSLLILGGAALLWMLRVKDPAIRLAACTAMLCGSLLIPALTAMLPAVPAARIAAPVPAEVTARAPTPPALSAPLPHSPRPAAPLNWIVAVEIIYALGTLVLLLRLGVGLAISVRLLRRSRATGRTTDEIDIRESDHVQAPVTLGTLRPAIVLPADWRRWDAATLEAVLAHERSHIRRHDPAVQVLSAIHRAILWHSPLSWFLHRSIVRMAEEASDDAAVAATSDRAFYAEVLLQFVRRESPRTEYEVGVPMARHERPDHRIHRILDGTSLSTRSNPRQSGGDSGCWGRRSPM